MIARGGVPGATVYVESVRGRRILDRRSSACRLIVSPQPNDFGTIIRSSSGFQARDLNRCQDGRRQSYGKLRNRPVCFSRISFTRDRSQRSSCRSEEDANVHDEIGDDQGASKPVIGKGDVLPVA